MFDAACTQLEIPQGPITNCTDLACQFAKAADLRGSPEAIAFRKSLGCDPQRMSANPSPRSNGETTRANSPSRRSQEPFEKHASVLGPQGLTCTQPDFTQPSLSKRSWEDVTPEGLGFSHSIYKSVVKSSDGGWWAIDPIMGAPLKLREWMTQMSDKNPSGDMKILITWASRWGPGDMRLKDLFGEYPDYFGDLAAARRSEIAR